MFFVLTETEAPIAIRKFHELAGAEARTLAKTG